MSRINSKQKFQGIKAKENYKLKQLKIDLQCLPQDLQEIPKGKELRLLIQALGLNCKSVKLLSALPPSDTRSREVYTLWDRLRRSKGVKHSTKILKELYTELIRFSSGLPILPSTSTWLKRDRDGFPTSLRSLKEPLRKGSVVERRLTLGFVRTFEAITCKPEISLRTIVSPSKGTEWYNNKLHDDYASFCNLSPWGRNIANKFSKIREKLDIQGLIFSTKKGPYGGPSCGTLTFQWEVLERNSLIPLIQQWADYFNLNDFILIKQMMELKPKDLIETKDPHDELGKLVFLKAPGCKTRVVAVVNYWLQYALYPLHKTLYSLLKQIESDGTFDQAAQAERVRVVSETKRVWSFDLTAATDRLPLCIQETTMRSLDSKLGSLWIKTLNLISFKCNETKSNNIRYKVGQPMGAYSSWASLALTHHYIIQYCAYKLKKFDFKDYAVLGDDVAIWDSKVAAMYLKMIDGLDVKISLLKSFIPEKEGVTVAEFAKRIFCNGVNITPIPTLFQVSCYHDYVHWPTALNWLSQNGWPLNNVALGEVIDLSRIRPNLVNDFVCLVHIWNQVSDLPLFREEVSKRLPKGFENFTSDDVLRERLDVLSTKLIDIDLRDPVYQFLNGIKEINIYEGLARHAVGPISSEPSYFSLMRLTRMKAFEQLQTRFESAIMSKSGQDLYGLELSEFPFFQEYGKSMDYISSLADNLSLEDQISSSEPGEGPDFKHEVQGLEYLPYPSHENMKNELISNASHWKLRDKYFRLISRRLKQRLT